MHYVEMMVYQLPSEIIWRPGALIASVLFGVALGIACYHRLAFPVTRYCWLGGAILMVFAICAMHFTAMSEFEIQLSSLYQVPDLVLSDRIFAILLLSVVSLIMVVGFSALSIEINVEVVRFHRSKSSPWQRNRV